MKSNLTSLHQSYEDYIDAPRELERGLSLVNVKLGGKEILGATVAYQADVVVSPLYVAAEQ